MKQSQKAIIGFLVFFVIPVHSQLHTPLLHFGRTLAQHAPPPLRIPANTLEDVAVQVMFLEDYLQHNSSDQNIFDILQHFYKNAFVYLLKKFHQNRPLNISEVRWQHFETVAKFLFQYSSQSQSFLQKIWSSETEPKPFRFCLILTFLRCFQFEEEEVSEKQIQKMYRSFEYSLHNLLEHEGEVFWDAFEKKQLTEKDIRNFKHCIKSYARQFKTPFFTAEATSNIIKWGLGITGIIIVSALGYKAYKILSNIEETIPNIQKGVTHLDKTILAIKNAANELTPTISELKQTALSCKELIQKLNDETIKELNDFVKFLTHICTKPDGSSLGLTQENRGMILKLLENSLQIIGENKDMLNTIVGHLGFVTEKFFKPFAAEINNYLTKEEIASRTKAMTYTIKGAIDHGKKVIKQEKKRKNS